MSPIALLRAGERICPCQAQMRKMPLTDCVPRDLGSSVVAAMLLQQFTGLINAEILVHHLGQGCHQPGWLRVLEDVATHG